MKARMVASLPDAGGLVDGHKPTACVRDTRDVGWQHPPMNTVELSVTMSQLLLRAQWCGVIRQHARV
jgi:hypothetical protein